MHPLTSGRFPLAVRLPRPDATATTRRVSKQLINEYRAELDRLRAVSGSRREGVLSEAFKDLLKRWGRSHDLTFTPQHEIITPRGTRIYPDGALLHALRVPFGYWEAKDADVWPVTSARTFDRHKP